MKLQGKTILITLLSLIQWNSLLDSNSLVFNDVFLGNLTSNSSLLDQGNITLSFWPLQVKIMNLKTYFVEVCNFS